MVCPVMMRKKTYSRTSSMKRMGNICKVNGIEEISPEQLLISTPEGLIMFDIKESKFIDDSFSTAMHKTIASTFTDRVTKFISELRPTDSILTLLLRKLLKK